MITAVPPGTHGRHGDRAVLDRIVVDVIRAALVISDALRRPRQIAPLEPRHTSLRVTGSTCPFALKNSRWSRMRWGTGTVLVTGRTIHAADDRTVGWDPRGRPTTVRR